METTAVRLQAWPRTASAVRPWLGAVGIAAATAVLYLVAGHTSVQSAYGELAHAFLSGRLDVPAAAVPEHIPFAGGRAFLPFPPVPALPFMAGQVFGVELEPTIVVAFVGAAGVVAAYCLTRGLAMRPVLSLLCAAGFGLSTFGWAAATGGTWLYAQVLGASLAIAGLGVAVRRRWPIAAGVLLGLAVGSRLPVAFTFPLFVYLYRRSRRDIALLVLGIAAIAVPIAAYNVARFGSPIEFGYDRMVSFYPGVAAVLDESWFADGITSLTYIPRSIGVMLFAGPVITVDAPWVRPDWSGLSIIFAAPMFLLALTARGRLAYVALGAALLVMVPNWAHGSWGFYQLGYRFLIDAMPALLVALAIAYRERATPTFVGVIALGAIVNAYGLWADVAGVMVGPLVFP